MNDEHFSVWGLVPVLTWANLTTGLLEQEHWVRCEVPIDFQLIVDTMIVRANDVAEPDVKEFGLWTVQGAKHPILSNSMWLIPSILSFTLIRRMF
jgi:hypothetical protein